MTLRSKESRAAVMNNRHPAPAPKSLTEFRSAYLDYREGESNEPPSLEGLSGRDRRVAEAFVESSDAASGIDPYASRPSIEKLLTGIAQAKGSTPASEAKRTLTTPTNLATAARKKQISEAVGVPLTQLKSRGWIPDTDDIDMIETAVCELLEVETITDTPTFAAAARRANSQEQITPKQQAWLGRVRRIAEQQKAGGFDVEGLETVAERLPSKVQHGPKSLHLLPGILAGCGVRLVFLEGLPGGKLDGAVSFIEGGGPVIGLTTRGDRFDSLLYTLLHECAHLTLGHIQEGSAAILDEGLSDEHTDSSEKQADNQAREWLFPGGLKLQPFGTSWIEDTATRYSVHPSCVIGRLQHDYEEYTFERSSIPNVRNELRAAGLMS